MFDKHFIGLDVTGFENNGKSKPISRVTLLVDDENAFTAGNDTGMELLADCPHATQAMADAILSQVRGYQYQMFTGDDANLDPAAELGDGVTVNGVYSVISRIDDDGSGYSTVSAPGDEEMEDEYPAAGPMTREFNRKIAETRSSITKTVDSITATVQGQGEQLSEIKQTVGSITTTVKGHGEQLSEINQSVDSITVKVNGLNGSYSTLKQTVDSITLSVSNNGTSSTISLYRDNAVVSSQNISITGFVTFSDLSGNGTTSINGANIMTGTISSNSIKLMGEMNVYYTDPYYGNEYFGGYLGYMSGLTSDGFTTDGIGMKGGNFGGQCIATTEGARLSYGTSNSIYTYAYGSVVKTGNVQLTVSSSGNITVSSTFRPTSAGYCYLGTASFPWAAVYVTTGEIVTSDRNRKHDIEPLPDKYLDMLGRIEPKRFKMNDGTSGRYHVGFIAQDVENAMAAAGVDPLEFGGWVKDRDEDGNDIYMLRYEEFLAINTLAIQKLYQRLEAAGI